MPSYKLVVADRVKVPVKFTMNDAGKTRAFAFNVTCDRIDTTEIRERAKSGETLVDDFLRGVMKGWEGQTLVVDDAGAPAEFNDEARDVMLSTPGLASLLYAAYLEECGAKGKN